MLCSSVSLNDYNVASSAGEIALRMAGAMTGKIASDKILRSFLTEE